MVAKATPRKRNLPPLAAGIPPVPVMSGCGNCIDEQRSGGLQSERGSPLLCEEVSSP